MNKIPLYYRFPSFTLTELLISLSIYLIAMSGVVSLIAMSAGMLETFSKGYSTRASAMVTAKTLESIMNQTIELTTEPEGSFFIRTINGRNIRLSAESNFILLRETGADGMIKERKLFIRDSDRIVLKLTGQKGRKALGLEMISKGSIREKSFLTAYMKTADSKQ